jgi:hypothetical protein
MFSFFLFSFFLFSIFFSMFSIFCLSYKIVAVRTLYSSVACDVIATMSEVVTRPTYNP